MKLLCFLILCCSFIHLITISPVLGKNHTNVNDTVDVYDQSQPYCFRFTWLGPEYDNSSNFNGTCADYLDATRAVGVPCRQPLVVTYDGTPPDIDYMWTHHKTNVICRRARGQVCAKYSYYFNNEPQNVTYMCTKAFTYQEGPVTSGCYKQSINGYDVELCLCESGIGGYKPCNSASRILVSLVLGIVFIIALTVTHCY